MDRGEGVYTLGGFLVGGTGLAVLTRDP